MVMGERLMMEEGEVVVVKVPVGKVGDNEGLEAKAIGLGLE